MLQLLTLLGALALSLYGMKVMGEGILKVAGSRMRASLRRVSNHRLSNLWTGAWFTAIIQSSGAMIVMMVRLVNAGLLTLNQSVALTMGANIGTTFSAWFMALFGYLFDGRLLAIPIIVLALPFSYSSRIKFKPWCEILMGLALYMLGFTTFVSQMPAAAALPAVSACLSTITDWGFGSVLLFVFIGFCSTLLFRSSAATILISMALLASGWLELPLAVSLVIGDNVGTTITALLASRHSNVSARRAALCHLGFNLLGMLWAVALIYPVCEAMWQIVTRGTDVATPAALAMGVVLFHTFFNLVTALLLICFVPQVKALLYRLVPIEEGDEDEFHLHFLQGGMFGTGELAVEEARKEAALFGVRCQSMLRLTDSFMHMGPSNANYTHTYTRIGKYEKITDRLELEIVRYLNNIDHGSLSGHMAARVRSLYRIVDELESIGDACYKLSRTIVRQHEHKVSFIAMQQKNIDRMLLLTQQAIDQMTMLLQKPEISPVEMQRVYNQEDTINAMRGQLREQNIGNVQAGYYTYQSGTIYMDIVNSCEKLGDYVVNVLEAHAEQSNYEEN